MGWQCQSKRLVGPQRQWGDGEQYGTRRKVPVGLNSNDPGAK